MFPLIFYSMCAHKISFMQHLTTNNLCVKLIVRNMCKHIFRKNIYVHSKSSCVPSSHDQCARAHVHGLEGTLDAQWSSGE